VDLTGDLATLSSLGSQVDELADRVTQLAEGYRETPDSAVATELYSAERALVAARRSFERVTRLLGGASD
jgi:hypothetical protein